MTITTTADSLGVQIHVGDAVRVIHWGGVVRLSDVSRTATVRGFTHAGNVALHGREPDPRDDIARGRAVPGGCLAVQRRDGAPGHEGNRAQSPERRGLRPEVCSECGKPNPGSWCDGCGWQK